MNPDGNERLTAAVGVLLLVPVAVEVATVLFGVHTFMSWHVFVGLALIPVIVLKMASTGWRFLRYYTRDRAYVAHGPPRLAMRLLAPLFGSGVAMGRALRRAADDVLPAERTSPVRGETARLYASATAIVCGLVLGAAFIPAQHRWVNIRRDRNEGQSTAWKEPFSHEQSQRPQFSATGNASPIAATWTRRIEPP